MLVFPVGQRASLRGNARRNYRQGPGRFSSRPEAERSQRSRSAAGDLPKSNADRAGQALCFGSRHGKGFGTLVGRRGRLRSPRFDSDQGQSLGAQTPGRCVGLVCSDGIGYGRPIDSQPTDQPPSLEELRVVEGFARTRRPGTRLQGESRRSVAGCRKQNAQVAKTTEWSGQGHRQYLHRLSKLSPCSLPQFPTDPP